MSKRLLVFTACAVGLLATVGTALPYPLLAPLFADGGVNAFNHFAGWPPKLLLGLALAINPLGLLIGSAVMGPLSDRYGRRPLLLLTTGFSALGHLASAAALIAENYPLFMLARFITGLAEGNVAVARALLADELNGFERSRAFAWLNGAMYSGWLLGPLLAGATIGLGVSAPFLIAAAILGLTLVLGWMVFPRHTAVLADGGFWHQLRQRHALQLLKLPELKQLFVLQFAYCLGVFAFYEFYPLWLVEFAGFDTVRISLLTAVLCALMTATSVLVGRGRKRTALAVDLEQGLEDSHLVDRKRADKHGARFLPAYALLVASCIALVALGGPELGILALVAFGLPNALYNASLPVYVSERFEAHGQGAVMGLLATTACLANVVIALIGTALILLDTRLILVLGALATAWAGWRIGYWLKPAPIAGVAQPALGAKA